MDVGGGSLRQTQSFFLLGCVRLHGPNVRTLTKKGNFPAKCDNVHGPNFRTLTKKCNFPVKCDNVRVPNKHMFKFRHVPLLIGMEDGSIPREIAWPQWLGDNVGMCSEDCCNLLSGIRRVQAGKSFVVEDEFKVMNACVHGVLSCDAPLRRSRLHGLRVCVRACMRVRVCACR